MTSRMLTIENLSLDFHTHDGVTKALNKVNVTLDQGEIRGLVGESGSGKSVTARSIMQLNPGNAVVKPGSIITLNDGHQTHDVLGLRGKMLKLVRGGLVSMIFQEPMASFAPAIRLGDQICESIQIHHNVARKEARSRGIALFDRVGIPQPEMRFDQYVFELSGGMRQRAMIAMALATKPKLLIADEPTTALDVTVQAQVLDLLLELREKEGMSMLFISHDLGVVSKIADQVTVMKKGEVVEAGAADDVLFHPQHAYTQKLISALPRMETLNNKTPDLNAVPLVSINNLQISYPVNKRHSSDGKFHAVKDVSMNLPKGEIIGLVGESGSGKTSLGKALLGAAPISSGSVTLFGESDIRLQPGQKINRKQLAKRAQMVFQDPYGSLNPRMTVRDIIAEPLEAIKLTKDRAETDKRVIEIARRCQLELDHLRRFPHAFSGGQRQRISIARALVCRPEFLIADESVAALDVSIQAEILRLLRSLCEEMGLTILFISHDLSVVANLCDHVCVMKHGELVEEGSVKEIFLSPQQPYTKALIGAIPLLENRLVEREKQVVAG